MNKCENNDSQLRVEIGSASDEFARFLSDIPSGVLLVPTSPTGNPTELALASETYSFAKWVKKNSSDVLLNVADSPAVRVLRGAEYWFPLAFLATDVSLPIYLNLVANYLYDRLRGTLHHDSPVVELEVLFQDDSTTKRFSYKGSVAGLKAIIKKFDPNRVMDPPDV